MSRTVISICTIIIALLVSCNNDYVVADTLIFNNGDTVTGKLINLEKGKLTFETDMLGKITVDVDKVKNIVTSKPDEFHFKDGTVIKSQALPAAQPGKIILKKTNLLAQQQFPLDLVVSINPAPAKPVWSGNIVVGLSSTHGNTFNESAAIDAAVQRRTKKTRWNIESIYMASRSNETDATTGKEHKVTTEENFQIKSKLDYFLTKKFYTYVSGNYKKDHIADLDYRIIAGAGAGYQWFDTDKFKFNTNAGLAERCEQYVSPNPSTGIIETTKTDNASLRLGYHLDWQMTSRFSFIHNTNYYPSMETGSDYYLTTDGELRAKITEAFFASFKAIMDYNSSPADGVGTTDTRYILGAGWHF